MRRAEKDCTFYRRCAAFFVSKHARETSSGHFSWFSGEDLNIMINILETSLEQFENMDDV